MFLEAMIYAVKKANDDASILRSVKLGGLGMDDCSNVDLSQTILAQVSINNQLECFSFYTNDQTFFSLSRAYKCFKIVFPITNLTATSNF